MRVGELLDHADHLLAHQLPELPPVHVRDRASQCQRDREHGVHAEILLALHQRDRVARARRELPAALGGEPLELQQGAIEIEERGSGQVATAEVGGDHLADVVDRVEAALALIAARSRKELRQRIVSLLLDLRRRHLLAEGEHAALDLFQERAMGGQRLRVLGSLEDTVHQVHGLAGARGGSQRGGASKGQPEIAVRQAHLHFDADGRDPGVGRLLAGKQICHAGPGFDLPRGASAALDPRDLGGHGVVLHQPLGVGAAPRLQAERVRRERDVGFHVVVGALRAVRDHQLEALAECDQHGQHRLVQRADLIRLDQRRVDQAAVRRALDRGVVGGDEIVADDQEPLALLLVEPLPSLVVVLREAIFDREHRYLVLANRAVEELEHPVAIEHDLPLVAPEEIHADAVRDSELLAIGGLELAHRGVERDRDVVAGDVAALLDRLLHHHPQPHLGQRVLAGIDVWGEPTLEPDSHHAAAFRVLDDLLQPGLQRDGHLLSVEIVASSEDQEHRLLHADVGLGVLLLGVPSTHAAVAKLPGCPDGTQVRMHHLLHALLDQALLGLGGAERPACARRQRLGGLACLALALAELAVLAAIGDQEVEPGHDSDAEQQPAQVDRRQPRGRQAQREQHDRGRQDRDREVAADARTRRGHRQVVRRVGVVVEPLPLDADGAAPGREGEQLRERKRAPQASLAQLLLHRARDRFVERVEPRRGQEVADLVERNRHVEGRVDEERRDHGLRAQEDELEHLGLGDLERRQRQHRGDEGRVKGDQDVVGEDPAFLKGDFLKGDLVGAVAGRSHGPR